MKPRSLTSLLWILTGIAFGTRIAIAACDGPTFVPAYTTTCTCAPGFGCPGIAVSYGAYYTCGGNTTEFCSTQQKNIGNTFVCTATVNLALKAYYDGMYWACVNVLQNPVGTCAASYQDPCLWTTCTVGTIPTPIVGDEYTGSSGECNLASARDDSLEDILTAAFPIGQADRANLLQSNTSRIDSRRAYMIPPYLTQAATVIGQPHAVIRRRNQHEPPSARVFGAECFVRLTLSFDKSIQVTIDQCKPEPVSSLV